MPKISIKKFAAQEDAETFLNGGVVIACPSLGALVYGLVGKTLIFTQPSSVTVTFTSSEPNGAMTMKQILEQIAAAIPALALSMRGANIHLVEKSPTNGVTVSHTSTAAAFFGLSTATAADGTIFPPATATPSAPCLLQILGDGSGAVQCVIYEVTP